MTREASTIEMRCEFRMYTSGGTRYVRLCNIPATNEVVWFDGRVERRCEPHTANARHISPGVTVRRIAPAS